MWGDPGGEGGGAAPGTSSHPLLPSFYILLHHGTFYILRKQQNLWPSIRSGWDASSACAGDRAGRTLCERGDRVKGWVAGRVGRRGAMGWRQMHQDAGPGPQPGAVRALPLPVLPHRRGPHTHCTRTVTRPASVFSQQPHLPHRRRVQTHCFCQPCPCRPRGLWGLSHWD